MVRRTRTASRRPRGVLVVLSAAALVLSAGEYLAPANGRLWLANSAWTVGVLVGVIGVWAARRRSDPRSRPGWTLLLASCTAWLGGQCLWTVYSATGFPQSPNAADVCWLVSAVFAGLGVHRLHPRDAAGPSRAWVEVTPLVVAVCALLAALSWDTIEASALAAPAAVTALGYPVFYVSAALVMLQSVLAGTLDLRGNRGLAAVLAGLVIEAIAFILWSPLLLNGTYVAGTSVIDALWSVGMLLVGLGASAASPPTAVADVHQISRRRGAILPSVTFGVLAAVQAFVILSHGTAGAELALGIGMSVVGAMLIGRASVLRREQDALLARLHEREGELREVNRRLSAESRSDPLTRLANRLRLREDFIDLAARAERYGETYCLVLCDLDRFKDYNDQLGHQAGDCALRDVAALLAEQTRGGDRAYRYGGEELLLVLPRQDADAGASIAERHREGVAQAAWAHPANPPFGVLTFSAGVAALLPGETPAQVLLRADEALYRAKAAGRNQVAMASLGPSLAKSGPGGPHDAEAALTQA